MQAPPSWPTAAALRARPSTVAGAGTDCCALAASSTGGLTLVGHTAWFDTTLGDYLSANRFECE